MANTINFLTYANTFAHWVITTNALVKENNDFAANNFVKPTGTLYLNDPSLGLQVANNASISGQLQSLGIGSGAYVQNVLRVDGYANLTNTSVSLYAAGTVNANGPNNGLYVANNTLMAGNLRVLGNTILNVLTANTITGNLVSLNLSANTVTANTLTVPTVIITTKLEANSAPISYFNNLVTQGQLTVGGNFVINGTTVYNANVFTLNAGSALAFDSIYSVNRGTAGANAQIKWSESDQYWAIRDVNNPTNYSKILTANLISDSTVSSSSSTVASSAAVNSLNTNIQAAFDAANSAASSSYSQASFAQANAANNLAQSAYNKANTSGATFVGTSGSATSSNGIVSFSSTNGVTVTGSSNVLSIATSQDLRTTASPTFAGLTLTAPLAVTQGGTGGASKSDALTNLLPTGAISGYVLTTGGSGSYYWAAGGGGGGGATPGTTINSTRSTATGNGTGLSYTVPTYTPGASQLRVYFDGVRQFASEYTETSNTIVTFSSSPATGTAILFEVDGYIINSYYANNTAYSVNGNLSGTANTIQLAIDALVSKLVINYANTSATINFTNLVTSTTPSTNTSNTQVATTLFVKNALNGGNTYAMSVSGSAATVANTGISGLITASQLASTGVTVGSYGGTSVVPVITIDAQGRITSAANAATTYVANNTNAQLNSLGVGTNPDSANTGTIRATNNITAYYSDDRLKTKLGKIENALSKIVSLEGFYYEANETAQELGYKPNREVGVSAQQVQKVLPEVVVSAPIDDKYLTVHYDRLIPLVIEAIKELKQEIDALKGDNK